MREEIHQARADTVKEERNLRSHCTVYPIIVQALGLSRAVSLSLRVAYYRLYR